MFLLCKHVRLTCVFNKLMMMVMMMPLSSCTGINDASEADVNDIVMVVNELLTYVQHYRDKSNVEAMHKIIVGFFLPSEIVM